MTTAGMTPDLDLYDIAFLAGGVHRVVDTALVALVESGGCGCTGPGSWRRSSPTAGIRSRQPCWTPSARAVTGRSTRSAGGSRTTSGSAASADPWRPPA